MSVYPMPKEYAARQLLALGPLTFRSFVLITGWHHEAARSCLDRLRERNEVRRKRVPGVRRDLYELAQ